MSRVVRPVLAAGVVLLAAGAAGATWAWPGGDDPQPSPRSGAVELPTTVASKPSPLASTTAPTTVIDSAETVPVGRGVLVTPGGVITPILSRAGDGWQVRTPCGRSTTVAIGEVVPTADVVIDAGHGGSEPGAVGPSGLVEKDVTLDVARRVADALRAPGRSVVLTRTADYRMTLYSRAEVARQLGAHVFVSIHFNAEPDGASTSPGTETYYQYSSRDSKRLAAVLYEDLLAAVRPLSHEWVGDRDAGVKYRRNDDGDDYYGLLRHAAGVPATLLEPMFISSAVEESLLRTDSVRSTLADAIRDGAVRYLDTDDQGSGFVEPYERDGGVGGGDIVPAGCVDPVL